MLFLNINYFKFLLRIFCLSQYWRVEIRQKIITANLKFSFNPPCQGRVAEGRVGLVL